MDISSSITVLMTLVVCFHEIYKGLKYGVIKNLYWAQLPRCKSRAVRGLNLNTLQSLDSEHLSQHKKRFFYLHCVPQILLCLLQDYTTTIEAIQEGKSDHQNFDGESRRLGIDEGSKKTFT